MRLFRQLCMDLCNGLSAALCKSHLVEPYIFVHKRKDISCLCCLLHEGTGSEQHTFLNSCYQFY